MKSLSPLNKRRLRNFVKNKRGLYSFWIFFVLFIEVIFSLDGLGLLGYEAALTRDYPVIFATLYFFSLLGLVMGIIGDFMYSLIDPRIDFESRE